MKKTARTSLVILVIVVLVVGGGLYLTNQLRASVGERFGIYLLKNNELVISDDDIVWYDWSSHEIRLTEEGAKKIQALNPVSVIYGEPFVLKIGDQEIYNGSFWTPISSMAFQGIIIETIVHSADNTVKLQKGYPTEGWYQGEDPRNDPRIFDHFQRIGKLTQTQMPTPTSPSSPGPAPSETPSSEAGFRIYFLENNTLLISDADILYYNWTSQEMAITDEASERLRTIGDSLYRFDTGFVIKINGEEIYRGIFRSAFMSAIPSPPKISIEFPSIVLASQSENHGAIRMFYPFFQPPSDQKVSNTKIFQYFEQNNKLKN